MAKFKEGKRKELEKTLKQWKEFVKSHGKKYEHYDLTSESDWTNSTKIVSLIKALETTDSPSELGELIQEIFQLTWAFKPPILLSFLKNLDEENSIKLKNILLDMGSSKIFRDSWISEFYELIRRYNPKGTSKFGEGRLKSILLNVLGEIYGKLHITEAPIYNTCARRFVSKYFKFDPKNYEDFRDAFEKLKREYLQVVGKLSDDNVPINAEIDMMFNCFDKDPGGCRMEDLPYDDGFGHIRDQLDRKGQVILYGPPGTGKTWLARNYVVRETGEDKPGNRWEFITFHQSYSYEEFIEGFRPKTDDNGHIRYEVEDGIFKKMAIKAIWSAIVRDFENVWNLFRKVYPEGSSLKTKTGNEFRIVRFTEGGLFIKPENGSNEHHLSTKNLRLLWEHGEVQTIPEVTSIIGDTGSGSYYFAVYRALLGLLNPGEDYNEVKKRVIEHLRSRKVIDFSNAPKFYLIIDEINRGNISKILGELITLLEKDKLLGSENQLIVTLPYSGEPFAVPPNLYIIGTMNTADRSIALLDVALRRRFAFIEVEPNPEKLMNRTIESINLSELLKTINDRITVVKDRDHRIGHSYFMKVGTVEDLKHVWYYEVLPLLMEYFYNDWETIKWVLKEKDKDSGNVFFEKLKLTGPNGEEAYQLKILEDRAFIEALNRIIGTNHSSTE